MPLLTALPVEILHRIFGFVPSHTVIRLSFVCRLFQDIFADGRTTIWRDVLMHSKNFHDNSIIIDCLSQSDWKSFVQADGISFLTLDSPYYINPQDFSWLSQLIVLKRKYGLDY
jgi:hypothetical protein